jgi:hypothetical protein
MADARYVLAFLLIQLLMTSDPGKSLSSSMENGSKPLGRLGHLTRKPQRISITIPYGLYQALIQASDYQGRSLSNLASFLLEEQLFHKGTGANPAAHQRKV